MIQLSVSRTVAWHMPCHQRLCGYSVSSQHGARWVSRGRQRPQQQISFGRRRAQDYEEDYEQEYEQGIAPAPEPVVEQRSVPLYVTIPGVLLVVFALFKIFKKIQGRG